MPPYDCAAARTTPRSILQYAQPQDEPKRNRPTNPATSRTRHHSSSAGSTYPPPCRFCFRNQSPRFFAWLTTRRRARNSLTFTVFPFRLKTSAISSIEYPSTSFRISISRSRSSNPSSNRSTCSRASIFSLISGPGFSFSPDVMTCLACSSLKSDSYTRGRTFFFLNKSQHSFTVILYSQVLNAARWSNRFSEKYALMNTCCAISSTSSRLRKIPPATANTLCWCRRISSSKASLSSACAHRTSSRSSAAFAGLEARPVMAVTAGGLSRGSSFGTRAIGIWLRPLFPVCPNLHHMLHFVLAKFLLAFHLTDMQQCLHDYW